MADTRISDVELREKYEREAPPPEYHEVTQQTAGRERGIFNPLPSLNEAEAKQALLEHVSGKCCYDDNAARRIAIHGLDSSMIYKYTLNTFTEARKLMVVSEPHRAGAPVDGPECGPTPRLWDVYAKPRQMFKNETALVKLPHAETVKLCGRCDGSGQLACGRCGGDGWVARVSLMPIRPCIRCGSSGKVTCCQCGGMGRKKYTIKVQVTWANHKNGYICTSDNWNIAATEEEMEKLQQGAAFTLFEVQQQRVRPLARDLALPVQLPQGCLALLEQHSGQRSDEKIIQQYHSVDVIPVTVVSYTRKNKVETYKVYGEDRRVLTCRYQEDPCTIL